MRMDYEFFKEVVTEKFMEYLPEQYKTMKLDIQSVNKVNMTLDRLSITREGIHVSPAIYINDMYEEYKKSEDLQGVLVSTARGMDNSMRNAEEIARSIDFSTAKDNIVFQLVNTEQNQSLLAEAPNRQFLDLSIIYRWVMKVDKDGIQSSVVLNSVQEQLGLSEEELFRFATDNTRRIFPPTVRDMIDVMRDDTPREMEDMMICEMLPEQTIWVIGNERGINGAISMMYEDKLRALSEKLESDLYIMPSSVHEVIAVSSNMGDPNKLAQMVAEINIDQVALNDRLSNQVYHYSKDLRKLSVATDTPNKRLDRIVAKLKVCQ